jgi:hypothetical protein
LHVFGHKAYLGAAEAAQLWLENRIEPKTIKRCNPHKQLQRAARRLCISFRQAIETVQAQPPDQFHSVRLILQAQSVLKDLLNGS